jgi:hypothetical protein
MPRPRACSATRATKSRSSPTRWNSTSATVVPSISGPKRPQDRIAAETDGFRQDHAKEFKKADDKKRQLPSRAKDYDLGHGDVVIAAITSCTNTSNPSVLIGAGLVARKALEKGLKRKPWVKTSLAPGAQVVTDYLERAGLQTTSTRSASTSSATAAPPASATPARLTADLQGDQRQRPDRLLGAVRQPQLRGPRQSRTCGQLPGLAAAGRRLCACRHLNVDLTRDRSARTRTATRLPEGHLADHAGDRRPHPPRTSPRDVPDALFRRLQGRRDTGRRSRSRAVRPTPGRRPPPMSRTRPTSKA